MFAVQVGMFFMSTFIKKWHVFVAALMILKKFVSAEVTMNRWNLG